MLLTLQSGGSFCVARKPAMYNRIQKFSGRASTIPRDLYFFIAAATLFSFANSIINAVFNNYLNETFSITDFQRGLLEMPRELPGFLVVFISALFFFISTRRLASMANLLAALGICSIALFSTGFPVMLCWLFVFSIGQHMYLPLNPSIAMEFAKDGTMGRRLGQLSGAMNLSAIAGSFIIFAGFRYLHFSFTISFLLSGAGFFSASLFFFLMKPDKPRPSNAKFVLRREYRLFYWLNILFGTRKQIFLTFAPWVLVTIFKQPTQTVATLLLTGGIIGIFFNPVLGRAIDRFGERTILMAEAVVLVFICLGYGFAASFLSPGPALATACACFIIDQLLMSVGMARATYIKKIAVVPEDVSQTLTMGVTIDHLFSILVALISGFLWVKAGYQYVFILGSLIAVANFFSAARIKISNK